MFLLNWCKIKKKNEAKYRVKRFFIRDLLCESVSAFASSAVP